MATTAALYTFDKKGRTHVSVNLNMEFLSPATTGPSDLEYFIDAKVLKVGRQLAFTEAVIREGDRIVARGTHTKCFLDQAYRFE